jgi:hypothetical protein
MMIVVLVQLAAMAEQVPGLEYQPRRVDRLIRFQLKLPAGVECSHGTTIISSEHEMIVARP